MTATREAKLEICSTVGSPKFRPGQKFSVILLPMIELVLFFTQRLGDQPRR